MKERVIVAMSGGVDSGVAAARLVDAGYEVVGVTLHLWDYPDEGPGSHGRCCAPEDQYDARRTADALGFAHYTFDRRELFRESIVEPFVDAYLAGETPSPCTACNRTVKLRELLAIARRLNATKIATGHYAKSGEDADGRAFIAEGKDKQKDQSYFLYATPHELVNKLVFPLGDSDKAEVRAEALARKLPGATKGESQELCFVGARQGAYAEFIELRAKGRIRPGNIIDQNGQVVGQHQGLHTVTVGKRKGLGLSLGKPAFVTSIDPISATVHVGREEALGCSRASLDDVVLAPGIALSVGHELRVRVRYRHQGAAAVVSQINGQHMVLSFPSPVRAVAKGQIAVLYDGERVLGGGRIAHSESAPSSRD
jgi:tRNA-specific 2-thiouridylase